MCDTFCSSRATKDWIRTVAGTFDTSYPPFSLSLVFIVVGQRGGGDFFIVSGVHFFVYTKNIRLCYNRADTQFRKAPNRIWPFHGLFFLAQVGVHHQFSLILHTFHRGSYDRGSLSGHKTRRQQPSNQLDRWPAASKPCGVDGDSRSCWQLC